MQLVRPALGHLPSYRAEQAKKGKEKRNGEAPKGA